MRNIIVYIIIAVAIVSCKTTTTTTTSTTRTQTGKYNEDLSGLRPKFETADTAKNITVSNGEPKHQSTQYVEPKLAVNAALDEVLDSISKVNLAKGFVEGFTIQVYSGTKREEALSTKGQLSSSFPELNAEVQYAQPNFRVRAGKYYDRFQAQEDYIAIKRYFPNAIIIPERIAID